MCRRLSISCNFNISQSTVDCYKPRTWSRVPPLVPDGLSIDFQIRTANNTFWNVNFISLFWKKIGFRSVNSWNEFFQFSNNIMKQFAWKNSQPNLPPPYSMPMVTWGRSTNRCPLYYCLKCLYEFCLAESLSGHFDFCLERAQRCVGD